MIVTNKMTGGGLIVAAILFFLISGHSSRADWQYGKWSRDVAGAKREAYESNRPLVVMIGNLDTCTYCKSAWNQVLCDGGAYHNPAACTASDLIGDYGAHPMAAYALEKRLILLEVSTKVVNPLAQRVFSQYRHAFTIDLYPTLFIFHVKDEADLDDGSANALDPEQVDIVTGFVYRGNRTINGISTPSQSNLTFDNLRRILESFFPNPHWQDIAPPAPGGYETAIDLGPFPNGENPPAPGERWYLSLPSVGTYPLDGVVDEIWFTFTAMAEQRYFFSATGMKAPAGVNITCAVFASHNDIPYEPPLKIATGKGFSRLERGFYVDITHPGTYFLRVSRAPDPAVTGVAFILRAHQTVYRPPVGDASNPQWIGATPGHWTMDWLAASAAAEASGKAMLVVFSGSRWCPWCLGMEHQILDRPQFLDRAADKYLVMVDNRRRDNTGPSLLTDDTPGGYLETNDISPAAAAAKMEDNFALQTQLAPPGADTSLGYGRIGYPTMLYLRPDGSVVGRVTFRKLQDADETAACLDQLEALVGDPGEERDNFASETALPVDDPEFAARVVLTPPETAGEWLEREAKIGAVDERDWRVFSPAATGDAWSKTAWLFAVQAPAAAPAATVTMAVYDDSGVGSGDGNLLASASGGLADGVNLEFIPANDADHRLLIAVAGQNEVVDYMLRHSTRVLGNRIAFAAPVFTAVQTAAMATATVGLTIEAANQGPLVFSYWAEEIEGGAQAGTHFAETALEPTDFTIAEGVKIDGATFEVAIPLLAQGQPMWDGSRDFRIRLAAKNNCWIAAEDAAASVRIYSKPSFETTLAESEGAQYVPLDPLILPVYGGLTGVLEVYRTAGGLPDGCEWNFIPDGNEAGQVTIAGTPTEVGDFSLTLEAASDLDGVRTVGGSITVEITVKPLADINPHGLPGRKFAGPLFAPANQRQTRAVDGRLALAVGDDGQLTASVTHRHGTVDYGADGWHDIDEAGVLQATLVPAGEESPTLTIHLPPDGRGAGDYSAPPGETAEVEFLPVPWSETLQPAPYVGFYTVGLPIAAESLDQPPYQGTGFLSFTVDPLGEVVYDGQLADGTDFSGTAELALATNGDQNLGKLTLFNSLYDNQGQIGGVFEIVPQAERQEDEASVRSSDGNWLWRLANAQKLRLQPCGTDFDPTKSLSEQRLNTPEFFLTAPVPGLPPAEWDALTTAVLLTSVLVTEGENDRLTAQPALAEPTLQYDRQTGKFTGQFTLFSGQPDGVVATQTATMTGILTPAGSGCCSAVSIPVGQGFYLLETAAGPQSFPIVLTGLNFALQTDTPEPCRGDVGIAHAPDAGFATHLRFACSTDSARLILQNVGGRHDNWRSVMPGEDVGLDPGGWLLHASAPGWRDAAAYAFTIATDDLATTTLQPPTWRPGWNLVAIPDWKWVDQTGASAILDQWNVWGMKLATGRLVRAETLQPARAYWFHVPEGEDNTFPQLNGVDWPVGEESPGPLSNPAWNLLAQPADTSDILSAWRWTGNAYRPFDPQTPLPTHEGAWFYLSPE